MVSAQRQLVAAEERRVITSDALARYDAARMELEQIESEVRLAVGLWAETQGDSALPPSARMEEQAVQRAIISETAELARVADTAAFAAEVAASVLHGLEVMLPFKKAGDLIARETPRLKQLLDAAIQDIEQIYSRFAALDAVAQPDWQAAMDLRALGASAPQRLVSVGTVSLPAVHGRKVEIDVSPDPCEVARHRIALASLGENSPPTETTHNGDVLPPPPSSAPADFVSRALRIWKGE